MPATDHPSQIRDFRFDLRPNGSHCRNRRWRVTVEYRPQAGKFRCNTLLAIQVLEGVFRYKHMPFLLRTNERAPLPFSPFIVIGAPMGSIGRERRRPRAPSTPLWRSYVNSWIHSSI